MLYISEACALHGSEFLLIFFYLSEELGEDNDLCLVFPGAFIQTSIFPIIKRGS